MEATFKNGHLFVQLIKIANNILDNVVLQCSADGIMLESLDGSGITFLKYFWPKGSFSSYYCPDNYGIGINLDNFNKILQFIKKGDIVTLKYEDKDSLEIIFHDKS